ncbi:MAG TPA: peptide-methionine (S)-S-oxide reductase MsrA [Gemmatimonadaceae bacterium]|nr:peptide-methionine (S)-S-oxide reductase MsrA [Gemmatimonadaceae bacterium]
MLIISKSIIAAAAASLLFAAPQRVRDVTPAVPALETAVFAGGCFWGIEAVFEHVKGVTNAESGYSGGKFDDPSYEDVSSGLTGHAESVRVTFDPTVVTYKQLLKVFFSVAHDPTQLNYQGPDHGTQYRSAIFFVTPSQKSDADAYIDSLTKAHTFKKPIVTQVVPFTKFWIAEAYHQNYLEHHPNEPYIVYNDQPKLVALKSQLPDLYKGK